MRLAPCFFLCVASAGLLAATKAESTPVREPSVEEVQTIRQLLELPPERLSRMRTSIEKIERMSPEARRELATNLAKYAAATPDDRRKLMKDLRDHGGGAARAVEHYLKTLSNEEAKTERIRINALTPEARQEFIRTLIEKFGPDIMKGKKEGKKEDGKGPKRPPGEGDAPAAK